jgi:hypothetical protein
MNAKSSSDLVIEVRFWQFGEFAGILCRVGEWKDGDVYGLKYNHPYEDLELRGQITAGSDPYGMTIRYSGYMIVDEERTRIMARTLASIKRRIDSIRKELGDATTFGKFLLYAMKAMGIKRLRIYLPTGIVMDRTPKDYIGLADAASSIDYLVAQKSSQFHDITWPVER